MKKITSKLSVLILILCVSCPQLYPKDDPKDKPYFKEIEKLRLKEKSGVFNLNLDLFGGVTITKTKFEVRAGDTSASSLTNTTSKIGPSVGVLLAVDFFGYGFATGAQFVGKGYETSTGENKNLNYFNFPLLIYFGFDFGNVIMDGNLGPYFGLLLSQEDSPLYKVKHFDFGLTGSLQGAYMFQKTFGILLGFKYEYGGLNDLTDSEAIESIRTSSFFIYSGIKFVL